MMNDDDDDDSLSYLVCSSETSMSSADGLVIGQEDVAVFAPHNILFAGDEIVGLTCEGKEAGHGPSNGGTRN